MTVSQNWYLMAFGVELGPMSWDDLRQRASRGDLRPDSQVRQGDAGAFVHAADVSGLFGPPAEPRRPEQAVDRKPAPVARGPTAPPPVADPPTLGPPTSASPKNTKKTARARAAGPRVSLQLPGKPLAVLVGAALIACAGYFGWALWPPKAAPPDHQKVAALYRQAYEQIKQFRSNPKNQSPAGLQFQFSRTVAALRNQLAQSSGDSSAGQLAEAGSQLSQMLADCQAAGSSAEATRFADSEQRFLAILNSFQDERKP